MPRRHLFLDTEAYRADDGQVERQTFRLGVVCFVRQDRKGQERRPDEWGEFTDVDDLWRWVDARTVKGRTTVLWAHNLAYDLRIARAFTILPAMGWELEFVRVDRNQASAQWRRDGRSLRMADSSSWFPAKLETIGKLVGTGKGRMPGPRAGLAAWFTYCRRDVQVLRDAVLRALDWVEAEDLGNWKPTGAGQGWAAFRHRWLTSPILHHGNEQVAEAERAAAWTGRCEAWRHGDLGLGPWHELDFQSSYATIAHEVDVPVRLVGRLTPGNARRHLEPRAGWAALLDVEVTTDSPCVPTRGPSGICWPVGTFRSWLWDVEAAEVLREGGTVSIKGGWLYRSAPALRDWAGWILDRLDDPPTEFDPLLRLIVKGWSRSVIGRFGSRWSQWELFGAAHGPDVALSTMIDGDTGERSRLLTLGGRTLVEGDVTDAEDGAVHVMSYVMAVARTRLNAAMRAAGTENVAYVDTDGLLVSAAGLDRLRAAAIPGLRSKASWAHVEVFGPRQLVLDGQLRAAGIPRSSVRTEDGGWSGRVWRSLAGSLAAGEVDEVRIIDRAWTLKGTDNRRRHLDGGATAPYVVPIVAG